ncbi:MAG: hypothetical protein C4534_06795 [Gaiellales bacterium]|nr:MAG: hypothetical protein C4534_06795 [Gaiellales bacterium]
MPYSERVSEEKAPGAAFTASGIDRRKSRSFVASLLRMTVGIEPGRTAVPYSERVSEEKAPGAAFTAPGIRIRQIQRDRNQAGRVIFRSLTEENAPCPAFTASGIDKRKDRSFVATLLRITGWFRSG